MAFSLSASEFHPEYFSYEPSMGYYRITGSWDDPQAKRIDAQELKDDRQAGSPRVPEPAALPPGAQETP